MFLVINMFPLRLSEKKFDNEFEKLDDSNLITNEMLLTRLCDKVSRARNLTFKCNFEEHISEAFMRKRDS